MAYGGLKTTLLINGIHAKSGGGVTYLRNILPLLAERSDIDVHIVLHRDQFDLFYPLPEAVRPHFVNFSAHFIPTLLWEQYAIPILARVMNADVTFSPANYGPIFAPNHVIMLRNSLAVVGKETRLSKRIYWLVLAMMTGISLIFAAKVVAVSDYARRALSFNLGGKLEQKVRVIHHGVAARFFNGETVNESTDKILVVSDIYVQKNLHTLIEAVTELRKERPGLTLEIAGRPVDQGYFAELSKTILERNLGDIVTFLGGVDMERLAALYRSTTVFVFPSTVETFGNPLVEAMASGCAIACSNTAAMPEIVGDAAVYFDPLSAREMKDTIGRLLNDPALRRSMRSKALKRAENFSWERTANMTADLLVEVAQRNHR